MNSQYIAFSIKIHVEEIFRSFTMGNVYWIPGLHSEKENEYTYKKRFLLNKQIRSEQSLWFDSHFRYATDDVIQLFGQREKPYLVGPLLAAPDYWDKGYAFLEADLTNIGEEYIYFTALTFIRQVVILADRVFDGQSIYPKYSYYKEKVFAQSESSALSHSRLWHSLGPLEISEQELQLSFPLAQISISMPAMSRALYVLHLRHPEGIKRSKIGLYSQELQELYNLASVREDSSKQITVFCLTKKNSKAKDNLKHGLLRCNAAFKRAIEDELLLKPYLLTKRAKGITVIPIAKNSSLLQFPKNLSILY